MVEKNVRTYEKNGIEAIVDNDGILWLNEKHIEKGLEHKNLREITIIIQIIENIDMNYKKQRNNTIGLL